MVKSLSRATPSKANIATFAETNNFEFYEQRGFVSVSTLKRRVLFGVERYNGVEKIYSVYI